MTTYTTNLGLTEQISMPELYEFSSAGTYYRYTSYNTDITFDGNLYEARPIKRGGISRDIQFGKVKLNVDAPVSDVFQQYIASQPIEPVTLTVYRAVSDELTSYVIIFAGTVKSVGIQNNVARATCEARSRLLEQKLPKIIFQSYCNHDIYDTGCTVSDVLYRVTGTITAVSGSTLTAAAFGTYADDYFNLGKVVYGSDIRLITDHTGNDLTIQIPFDSSVAVGTEVYAYPGCDGDPTTCDTRFNNLSNFLGFPYIPSRNPSIWGFK